MDGMRILAALAVAAAVSTADAWRACAAAPDSAAVARLAPLLARTSAVRVEIGSRAWVLLGPRAESGGIGYDGLEHFPPPRPAVFVRGDWDTVPPPPRPVPWSAVSGLERRVETRAPSMVFGAAVGALLLGGLAYGFSRYADEDQAEAWSHAAIGGAIGAGAGALLGAPFPTPSWVREYPLPAADGNLSH